MNDTQPVDLNTLIRRAVIGDQLPAREEHNDDEHQGDDTQRDNSDEPRQLSTHARHLLQYPTIEPDRDQGQGATRHRPPRDMNAMIRAAIGIEPW